MSRQLLRLILLLVVVGISWIAKQQRNGSSFPSGSGTTERREATRDVGPASRTWGHIDSLPDHFARHGRDFAARNAEDYAAQAAAFLQRARTEGLPAKRDLDGSLRVYDSATGTFGAYNANGTTRTFFKPGNSTYFDHQPGESVDLRAGR
jgi:hypothetical protein